MLTDAVRHATQAGDWQLAADMVIDELAIGQLIEPRDDQCLAEEFMSMLPGQAWTQPAPLLVAAALALAAGQHESCVTALDAAEAALAHVPADKESRCRLAAAIIRLTASLGTGDLMAAAASASRAELMLGKVPGGKLARHPDLRRRCPHACGVVELWSGHLDEAVRIFEAGLAEAGVAQNASTTTGPGTWRWPRRCAAGAVLPSWPARRPWPPPITGRPAGTRTRRRWSRWPGCTYSAMSCARHAAASSRPTPPSARIDDRRARRGSPVSR